jgi:hypothetical protein
MFSHHLFASAHQRLDAERSLPGHGYDTRCDDIGGPYRLFVVDHPDAYLDRASDDLIVPGASDVCWGAPMPEQGRAIRGETRVTVVVAVPRLAGESLGPIPRWR